MIIIIKKKKLKLFHFDKVCIVHNSLTLASAIFYQTPISSPNDSPSKTLLHPKSPPRSRDIQVFRFFSLQSDRFKRTHGSGIIYDVMEWLA